MDSLAENDFDEQVEEEEASEEENIEYENIEIEYYYDDEAND